MSESSLLQQANKLLRSKRYKEAHNIYQSLLKQSSLPGLEFLAQLAYKKALGQGNLPEDRFSSPRIPTTPFTVPRNSFFITYPEEAADSSIIDTCASISLLTEIPFFVNHVSVCDANTRLPFREMNETTDKPFCLQYKPHMGDTIKIIYDEASKFRGLLRFIYNICILLTRHQPTILLLTMMTDGNKQSGYGRRSSQLAQSLRTQCERTNKNFIWASFFSDSYSQENSLFEIPNSVEDLKLLLSLIKPEVVICSSNHSNIEPLLEIRPLYNFKLVYELRGAWHESYAARKEYHIQKFRKQEDSFYLSQLNSEVKSIERADGAIYICPELKNYYSRFLENGFKPSIVAENSLDISSNSLDLIKLPDLETGSFKVGYIGSIAEYEGFDLLVKAIAELRKKDNIDISLVLAGKVSQSMRATVDKLILEHVFIENRGFISDNDELAILYRSLHCCIVPRLSFTVSDCVSPIKPYSLYSHNVRTILSDIKPLQRIRDDLGFGLLFKAGCVVSLTNAIRQTLAGENDSCFQRSNELTDLCHRSWDQIASHIIEFCQSLTNRKSLNFVYSNKWWISSSWSGASLNTIKEMQLLRRHYDIYYNDVYCSDLLNGENLEEHILRERISKEISTRKDETIPGTINMLIPSRPYLATLHRSGSDTDSETISLSQLAPCVIGHNYNAYLWSRDDIVVGFQTQISKLLAETNLLSLFGDDSTLGYNSNLTCKPRKSIIRLQALSSTSHRLTKDTIAASTNASLRLAVIGTIYEGTNPEILINAIDSLLIAKKLSSISLTFFSTKILIDLPSRDWISFDSFTQDNFLEKISPFDAIVNTWCEKACFYSGSNKNLDAINCLTPLILPRTPAYEAQLGTTYNLFVETNLLSSGPIVNHESMAAVILRLLDSQEVLEATCHLHVARSALSAENVSSYYRKQIDGLFPDKILVVNPSAGVGGVQKYSYMIASAFPTSSIDIMVDSDANYTDLDRINSEFPDTFNCRLITFKSFLENASQYDICFLNSYPVDEDRIRAILSHSSLLNSLRVAILHTDVHAFNNLLACNLDSFAIDMLYYVSDACLHKVFAYYYSKLFDPTLPHRFLFPQACKLQPTYNPVHQDRSSIGTLSLRTEDRDRTYRILYTGRCNFIKGVGLLLRVFKSYIEHNPDTKLKLTVAGPFSPSNLFHFATSLSNSFPNRIEIINSNLSKSAIEELMLKSDALVNASLMDGLPYVFLEASSFGLPIVTTNPGGISDFVANGVNGLVVDIGNMVFVSSLDVADPYKFLLNQADDNFESIKLAFFTHLSFLEDDAAYARLQASVLKSTALLKKKFGFVGFQDKLRKSLLPLFWKNDKSIDLSTKP